MTTAERAEMDILIATQQAETRTQADIEFGMPSPADLEIVMLIAEDTAFESYLDSTSEDIELDDVLAMLDDTDDLIECLDV